ncbi:MAG: copper amine oxidase N-terminal domain-containing protein [Peptococcaceae bacterium]|nr:copper amine oxidase N-terminal domain-containing protein [Peptococcaceae bacterium]
MKKTWKTLAISGVLMAACALPIQAASTDVHLEVNGVPIQSNAETGTPYISDHGRTMLPIRLLGELAGCSVDYDNGAVTVTNDALQLKAQFVNGQNTCTINGATVNLDEPMTISAEGRAYVPVRALAESFADVNWDNDSRTVQVTVKDPAVTAPSLDDWQFALNTQGTGDQVFVAANNEKTGQTFTLALPKEHFSTANAESLYVGEAKLIDDQLTITIGRMGLMGGTEKTVLMTPFADAGQTDMTYVGVIPYKSDYTIADGKIYYTDGTDQGPWNIDPNVLYVADLGDTANKKTVKFDFAVNACSLSFEQGMLVATEADGLRHIINPETLEVVGGALA